MYNNYTTFALCLLCVELRDKITSTIMYGDLDLVSDLEIEYDQVKKEIKRRGV